MTDFNYKEYSLSKLRDWISDALSSGEASAQEIYETILSEVEELSSYHQKEYENCTELMSLLKGHRPVDFLNETWTRTVEEDSITGELFVTLPEELLQRMNWKEGDALDWVNNYDGTFTLKKV